MGDGAFEPHYRISELCKIWGCGRESLRLIFSQEPGVVKLRMGRKKKNVTMLIPRDVAARVHLRLQSIGK